MAMQRWERVYAELQQRSERLGYAPPKQLGGGQSQTFEFKVRGEPVFLLAFRDLARKEDYKVHNRLWAEGLDLVLARYENLKGLGKRLPQAAAIVIDNIGDAYVVVMMDELLRLYHDKRALDRNDGHRRLTFVVQREPDGYYLQMPYGEAPARLTSVNTVDSLVLLLKAANPPASTAR
ncbi:MAG: hypothetical protein WKG32_23585 [Gemmatimonadaceae bacterium]